MNCKICGKELKEGAKFCPECGTKVNSTVVNEPAKPITVENNQTNNVPVSKSNGVASLVLGIISILFGFICFPLAIIGLVLGIKQKGKSGEKTAGIVLNTIALIISTISLLFIIIFIIAAYQSENGGGYYESSEDNRGNSDIIIKDDGNIYDYDYDYDRDFEDYFDFDID